MLASSSRTCCDRPVYPSRNNNSYRTGVALVRRGAALLLACLAAAASAQDFLPQQPGAQDPGHFEVRDAHLELDAGVYYLSAAIDYRLSSEAREALLSGVPLRFRLDVEFLHPRRLWFDAEEASLRQLYQLEYHALSERYMVETANSGVQESFSSLFAALNFLGRVEHIPLIDAAVLEPDRTYDLRLRAVLDVEQFPGPLRLLAFWRRDWSLASDWFRWQLQND
jgi:uncharacterized protein DUF4390